jgi:hypothetical protein
MSRKIFAVIVLAAKEVKNLLNFQRFLIDSEESSIKYR